MKQGWVCPECGAVMAPWVTACINCTGDERQLVPYEPTYVYPLCPHSYPLNWVIDTSTATGIDITMEESQ